MLKFYFLNFDYIGNDWIYRFYIVYKSVSLDNETVTIVYNFTENPISERITNDTTNSIIKQSEQVALNKKVCSNILPSLPPKKEKYEHLLFVFLFFYLLGDSNGSAAQLAISFQLCKNQKTTKNYSRVFPFFIKYGAISR